MNATLLRTASTALGLALLAGSAQAQITFTYNGGSPNASDWSRVQNWVALTNPNVGGSANTVVVMGPAPANRRNTCNVDLVNGANPLFNLNSLTFAPNTGGMYLLVGADMRFNSDNTLGGPRIVHNTDDTGQVVDNNVILNANLTIEGAANRVNATPYMRFDGVISQAGANNLGLIFSPTQQAMQLRLNGANTFAGQMQLRNGAVIVTGTSNAGTGAFVCGSDTAAHRQTVAAFSGRDAVLSNSSFELTNNTTSIGQSNFAPATLTINGNFQPNAAAQGAREVLLKGGRSHELILAGQVALGNQSTLIFTGDQAPTVDNGRILNRTRANGPNMPVSLKKDNLGSVVRLTGTNISPQANNRVISTMTGALLVRNCTLAVDCIVGSANNRIGQNWTIGAQGMPGALIGRSVINGNPPGIDPARIFFTQNLGLRVANGSAVEPGDSPGILALNGGEHVFEPGSGFAVTLNGREAGNGDGYYGQLMLEEQAHMTLQCSPTNQRPLLGIDLQLTDGLGIADNFFITPLDVGTLSFTIINQVSPLAPSLYVPADSLGYGGNMFMTATGAPLTEGAHFYNEYLPENTAFRISYFGGDGNDVVLTIVPSPGAASLAAFGGLAALRRRRR